MTHPIWRTSSNKPKPSNEASTLTPGLRATNRPWNQAKTQTGRLKSAFWTPCMSLTHCGCPCSAGWACTSFWADVRRRWSACCSSRRAARDWTGDAGCPPATCHKQTRHHGAWGGACTAQSHTENDPISLVKKMSTSPQRGEMESRWWHLEAASHLGTLASRWRGRRATLAKAIRTPTAATSVKEITPPIT